MALDDVCHVTRAAIADFHIVPVEQLVEDVCFREMFIDQEEERSCNIRPDICTVRWVKPSDISRSVLASVVIPVFDIYISKILMVASTKPRRPTMMPSKPTATMRNFDKTPSTNNLNTPRDGIMCFAN